MNKFVKTLYEFTINKICHKNICLNASEGKGHIFLAQLSFFLTCLIYKATGTLRNRTEPVKRPPSGKQNFFF